MTYSVQFEVSRPALIGIEADSDGYLAFQEAAGLGGRNALPAAGAPRFFEFPVYGRGADRLEQGTLFFGDCKVRDQACKRVFDKGGKKFSARVVKKLPDGKERPDKVFIVLHRPPEFSVGEFFPPFFPGAFRAGCLGRLFGDEFERFPVEVRIDGLPQIGEQVRQIIAIQCEYQRILVQDSPFFLF